MTLVDGKFVGISELEVVKVAQLTEMQMFPGYLKKYFIEPKLASSLSSQSFIYYSLQDYCSLQM